jgi:DNA replication protein DnaC
MSEKIDETLKKLYDDTRSGKIPPDDSDESLWSQQTIAGDPDCPFCGGLGYLRTELPVGHPEFGRLQLCTCRQNQISQLIRQRLYALSNLDELRHLTFENFQRRGRIGLGPWQADSLELAFNHSQQYARSLNGWLLLQGGYGCGKTHLASAIANFAVDLGVPTLFITVPDLLDTLRFAYSDPEDTFENRFEEIRRSTLLILDDFGTHNATPWAQEKLFQIINYRSINRLALVVTTNLMLEQIEGRIRSRLEDPEIVTRVHILAPDYRRPTNDAGHSALSSLDLHSDQTFISFEDRRREGLTPDAQRSLEKALREATDFAKNPHGWLVFTGPFGSGKTHLAAAIANSYADIGKQPLFIVVPDLLDHLRATFSPDSTVSLDRRFEEIRTASLLILDDLGAQSMTPWVREKLYQLFNYRYNAKLPTVITTVSFKDEIDARLLSRMQDSRLCKICAITAPAYHGGTPEKKRRSSRKY